MIVGMVAISGTIYGRPFPLWEKCLATLCTQCDRVHVRFDSKNGLPDVPDKVRSIAGDKLGKILISGDWNRNLYYWREELLRSLDDVRPTFVLTPDQDEEFEPGIHGDLQRLKDSRVPSLMFGYRTPMPTADGVKIMSSYPPSPHMKAFKWKPGLRYVPYRFWAQVTQYATSTLQMKANSRILHYCYWTAELRKDRATVNRPRHGPKFHKALRGLAEFKKGG